MRPAKAMACANVLALLLACGEPEPTAVPEATEDAAPRQQPPSAPAAVEPPAVAREEPPPSPPVPVAPPAPVAEEPAVLAPPAPAPPPPALPSPPPAPAEPEPAPALDLDGLEQRLRDTDSLGVLTKLALKNEIDDLVEDIDAFHRKGRGQLSKLRERFDLLVMKVMSLLQDEEPDLAQEIARSRGELWQLLADPAEFAKLSM